MEALVYSSRRTPDKASWHTHMRTDAASAALGGGVIPTTRGKLLSEPAQAAEGR